MAVLVYDYRIRTASRLHFPVRLKYALALRPTFQCGHPSSPEAILFEFEDKIVTFLHEEGRGVRSGGMTIPLEDQWVSCCALHN